MSRDYDTIVVGLGAMGSATIYQLAKAGNKVLGIDRYSPPHGLGSSHGDTRITRLAIGEGHHYTPIVRRSHEIWREFERETGARLLNITGGLIISSPDAESHIHVPGFFRNTISAAAKYGIPHEFLDAAGIRKRFPQFRVHEGEAGYYEPGAGYLRPEDCIRSQLQLAEKRGAEIHTSEKVTRLVRSGSAVAVETDKNTYLAKNAVVTAGPWLPDFLDATHSRHFKVFRQTLFWFDIDGPIEPFLPPNFPIFIWETRDAGKSIYGFPAVDGARGGIKIANETYDATTSADDVDRNVGAGDASAMHRDLIAGNIPGISDRCLRAETCLYTVTRDAGFVVDRHPGMDNVILVSACSGHGFKHSAAIGEALSQLIVHGASKFDLTAFRLGRFDD
jgi:sarcosine oxidase